MIRYQSLFALGLLGVVAGCGDSDPDGTSPGGGENGGFVLGGGAPGADTTGSGSGSPTGGNTGNGAGGNGSPTGGGNGTIPPFSNNGSGSSNGIEPENCFIRNVEAFAQAADMMIVLDRSSSMSGLSGAIENLFTGPNLWQPTTNAINSIVSDFGELIAFGLTVFPGRGMGGFAGGGEQCSAGTVLSPTALDNAGQISSQIQQNAPSLDLFNVGLTPTSTGLTAALSALGDRTFSPDTQTTPAYVILVTDGKPSCDGLGNTSQPDVDQAVSAITALSNAAIPTYVLGYGISTTATADGFVAADIMNQFAQAGGTGQYYEVGNGTFESTIREIAAKAVSCDFALDERPPDLDYVLVTIDGEQINLNDPNQNGWVINDATVSLQDGACNRIKDGRRHDIKVQVVCQVVVPI